VQIYRNLRQFTNLPAPGRFRASISYRWLDAGGRVVRQATRLTPICVQPDERPLLAVGSVAITPTAGSLNAQYAIALVNRGRGPAGPFDVALTVNGLPQPDLVVQSLAAGTQTVLPVVAPRCTPGSSVTVTIDPQNAISEAPGGGLPKTVACPLSAATAAPAG
jgi:CARDB